MQRRLALTATQIFLNTIEKLDRDAEPIGVRVLEFQVFTLDVVDLLERHPTEARDPVVDMDAQLARRKLAGDPAEVSSLSSPGSNRWATKARAQLRARTTSDDTR